MFGAPGNWERTALWSMLDIDGRSDVVVFYSGHGMPSRDGRGYLLPTDGHPALQTSCKAVDAALAGLCSRRLESQIVDLGRAVRWRT